MLVAFKTMVREAVRRLRLAQAEPVAARHPGHPAAHRRQPPRLARRPPEHPRLTAAGVARPPVPRPARPPAEPAGLITRHGDQHDHHPH